MIQTGLIPTGGVFCAPVATGEEYSHRAKQWELAEFAGRGSLADVYRARPAGAPADRAPNYAVKILRPVWRDDAQAAALMHREALVGRTVSHHHLVPVLSSSLREPPRLVVMPWLEGASLRALLDAGELFDAADALWIARQTAEALDALHNAGWTHGDVTPGNVIVAPTGHVTMIDFSFARRKHESGSAANRPVMGTCRYIAPELVTSALRGDIRSDIFSLGAVMYELLSGRVPYPAADLAELAALQRQTSPPDLARLAPHAPREVVRLVREMIANDPLRRPQSPRELVDRLAALEIGLFSARAWNAGA